MPARKRSGTGRPIGRPPVDPEQKKLVAFRVQGLATDIDRRANEKKSNRGTVARRDLQRYYSLVDSMLKSIDADPTEIAALADYLKGESEIRGRVTVRLFGPMVRAAAAELGTESLTKLNDAQVMALLDLFSRTDSPSAAGEVFAAETTA